MESNQMDGENCIPKGTETLSPNGRDTNGIGATPTKSSTKGNSANNPSVANSDPLAMLEKTCNNMVGTCDDGVKSSTHVGGRSFKKPQNSGNSSRTPPTSDKHTTTIGQQQRHLNGMTFSCAALQEGSAMAMTAAPRHKSAPTPTLSANSSINKRADTGKSPKNSANSIGQMTDWNSAGAMMPPNAKFDGANMHPMAPMFMHGAPNGYPASIPGFSAGTARSFGNPHAPPVTSAIGSNFPGMIQGPAFFPGAGGLVGFGQQPNVLSSIPPNLLQSPLNPPMHHFNSAQLQQIMAAMGAPQQNCPGAQTQAAQMAQQVGQNAVNGLPLFINAGLPGTNSSPAMPGATDMATAEFMMYNLQQQQLQQQQQNQLLAQFPLMAAAAAASLPVFSQPPSTTMSGQAMPKSMMNPSQASIVNGIMTSNSDDTMSTGLGSPIHSMKTMVMDAANGQIRHICTYEVKGGGQVCGKLFNNMEEVFAHYKSCHINQINSPTVTSTTSQNGSVNHTALTTSTTTAATTPTTTMASGLNKIKANKQQRSPKGTNESMKFSPQTPSSPVLTTSGDSSGGGPLRGTPKGQQQPNSTPGNDGAGATRFHPYMIGAPGTAPSTLTSQHLHPAQKTGIAALKCNQQQGHQIQATPSTMASSQQIPIELLQFAAMAQFFNSGAVPPPNMMAGLNGLGGMPGPMPNEGMMQMHGLIPPMTGMPLGAPPQGTNISSLQALTAMANTIGSVKNSN